MLKQVFGGLLFEVGIFGRVGRVAVVLPGLDKVVFSLANCLETIYHWKEFCVSKWVHVYIIIILEAIIARNCCLKDPVGKHACR